MVYDVKDLADVLGGCEGSESVNIRTPLSSYVIVGHVVDEYGDIILLTEKAVDVYNVRDF